MSDTNDIDELLRDLVPPNGYRTVLLSREECVRYHAALTALVAENAALKQRVAEQDADIKTLSASNAVLRGWIAAHSPANRQLERELSAMQKQRDEARELYCRQIDYEKGRLTGVFGPKEIAVVRGWEGLFEVSEPVSPKTTAPIHREPTPTPAPPPKKCCKGDTNEK